MMAVTVTGVRISPGRRLGKWLEAQAGQHINTVFSRFTKLPWIPDNERTREQFRKYVELDTFMEDGEICFYARYGYYYGGKGQARLLKEERGTTLYVHPKTKCLCVYKNNSRIDYALRRRLELSQRVRIIGDYHQYYKIDGMWYEIKAEPLPATSLPPWPSRDGRDERKGPRDILLERNGWANRYSHSPYVKITLKRQLNWSELVHNCLENDPPTAEQMSKPCPKCGGIGKHCMHYIMRKLDPNIY